MTTFKRGDTVLVKFPFSEGTGFKKRPGLVISSDDYNEARQEVIIAGITGNIERVLFGDTVLDEWREAGLKYPSLIAGIVQTIKNDMIVHRLGIVSEPDRRSVDENLKKSMGF